MNTLLRDAYLAALLHPAQLIARFYNDFNSRYTVRCVQRTVRHLWPLQLPMWFRTMETCALCTLIFHESSHAPHCSSCSQYGPRRNFILGCSLHSHNNSRQSRSTPRQSHHFVAVKASWLPSVTSSLYI